MTGTAGLSPCPMEAVQKGRYVLPTPLHTVLEDGLETEDSARVAQRISLEKDQIGALAWLDGANSSPMPILQAPLSVAI